MLVIVVIERKTQKVIDESNEDNLQPFKEKMGVFIENSKKNLENEFESLKECRAKFVCTMKFYHFRPKKGTLDVVPPSEFFDLWFQFCVDFKDIFKKEILRLEQEK